MVNKRVLFYSSVNNKRQFSTQGFYRTDISLLRDLGYSVSLSNSWIDYLFFWRYDVAFIYFYRYGLVPALLARLTGKVVLFTGGIDYLDRSFAGTQSFIVQSILFNFCGLFSHVNIIVSDADFVNCNRITFLFSKKRNRLAKHCIDVEKYACVDPQHRAKSIVTIAWMARTENVIRKGVLDTIRLFQHIHKIDKDFRLFIIGSCGEGTIAVRALIGSLGLEEQVILTGAVSEEEKIARLKNALAYAQLSKYEGFGIAAIEALAAGAVVIHSNAGGLKEAVASHGIVWSDGDSCCIDQLFQLLGDPQRHAAWATAGLDHVRDRYARSVRLERFRFLIAELDRR